LSDREIPPARSAPLSATPCWPLPADAGQEINRTPCGAESSRVASAPVRSSWGVPAKPSDERPPAKCRQSSADNAKPDKIFVGRGSGPHRRSADPARATPDGAQRAPPLNVQNNRSPPVLAAGSICDNALNHYKRSRLIDHLSQPATRQSGAPGDSSRRNGLLCGDCAAHWRTDGGPRRGRSFEQLTVLGFTRADTNVDRLPGAISVPCSAWPLPAPLH
jgi:hypothetical protein